MWQEGLCSGQQKSNSPVHPELGDEPGLSNGIPDILSPPVQLVSYLPGEFKVKPLATKQHSLDDRTKFLSGVGLQPADREARTQLRGELVQVVCGSDYP